MLTLYSLERHIYVLGRYTYVSKKSETPEVKKRITIDMIATNEKQG